MYDALHLLVDSFEKAPSKGEAVEELAKIKSYDGVLGLLEQNDEGIFQSRAIVKIIRNGKTVTEE
jgi:hypothetical protein